MLTFAALQWQCSTLVRRLSPPFGNKLYYKISFWGHQKMRNHAYVSHHPVYVGKSESLSKSSLLVIAQVICIYAFYLPPLKRGDWKIGRSIFWISGRKTKQTNKHRHPLKRCCTWLCRAAEKGFNFKRKQAFLRKTKYCESTSIHIILR